MSKYKAGSLEAQINSLIPAAQDRFRVSFPSFTRGFNGWECNDEHYYGGEHNREDVIQHIAGRFRVFKENYEKRATVKRIDGEQNGNKISFYSGPLIFANLEII